MIKKSENKNIYFMKEGFMIVRKIYFYEILKKYRICFLANMGKCWMIIRLIRFLMKVKVREYRENNRHNLISRFKSKRIIII